jgi:hypothetical protein
MSVAPCAHDYRETKLLYMGIPLIHKKIKPMENFVVLSFFLFSKKNDLTLELAMKILN